MVSDRRLLQIMAGIDQNKTPAYKYLCDRGTSTRSSKVITNIYQVQNLLETVLRNQVQLDNKMDTILGRLENIEERISENTMIVNAMDLPSENTAEQDIMPQKCHRVLGAPTEFADNRIRHKF